MALSIPQFVPPSLSTNADLHFVWDDTRVDEDFHYDPDPFVQRTMARVALRGQIALAIGMYEWIIWRFHAVSADPLPFHVAEAAWCANVDLRYMKYVELDRERWVGPIRGPLWCAVTWLLPMIFWGDERPEESESGLSFLARLGVHVMPDPVPFQAWLDLSTTRAETSWPAPPGDPFADLFGEQRQERRGPLVPPQGVDPAFGYSPQVGPELVAQFLASVDYRLNPFLRSPEELIAMGFRGRPYSL